MWLSWQQSGLLTVALLAVLAGISVARRRAVVVPVVGELALIAGLYTVWRFTASLHTATSGGAYDRAHAIADLERWLHLPSERAAEAFLLDHHTLATICNRYYQWSHGSILVVALIVAFVRARPAYRQWRTGLAVLTGISLFLHFIPVAPPRLMGDLGYVDQARVLGQSVYAPFGSGSFDQLAAMPSLHVGWALVAAGAWWTATAGAWRWLGVGCALATFVVVAVTAQHWWLDGIVSAVLLAMIMLVQRWVRAGRSSARIYPAALVISEDRA